MDLSLIDIGGPCKVTDNGTVIYFDDDVQLIPNPVYRDVENQLTSAEDGTLVDLTWTLRGRPRAVWSYNTTLVPSTYTNFTVGGTRLIGAANRSVVVLGADGQQFTLNRAVLTKMPEMYLGLGKPLWGECEWTGFIKTAAALTDADAFMSFATGIAWSQADFPTTNEETMFTGSWGAAAGNWTTVYAEDGFSIQHELKLQAIKQGNVTVDQKFVGYRSAAVFKPQGPTSTQLINGLNSQGAVNAGTVGATKGIGTRQSVFAADFVITNGSQSVTVKGAALRRGQFMFGAKPNRHGEWGMVSALTAPGSRLVVA